MYIDQNLKYFPACIYFHKWELLLPNVEDKNIPISLN